MLIGYFHRASCSKDYDVLYLFPFKDTFTGLGKLSDFKKFLKSINTVKLQYYV